MVNRELTTEKWVNTKINGVKVKVSFNEIEIYKSLKDFGLRFARIDRVGHFYFRHDRIVATNLMHIEDLVLDTLKSQELPNKQLVLNTYAKYHPIKNGEALKHILRDELTTEEVHLLKLQVDFKYQKQYEIENTIKIFGDLHFRKTVDMEGYYGNTDIYFKRKSDKEFVVLSHYAKGKSILKQGFDCWRAIYKRESDIGTKKPLSIDSLRLSFHLEKDFQLIQ